MYFEGLKFPCLSKKQEDLQECINKILKILED